MFSPDLSHGRTQVSFELDFGFFRWQETDEVVSCIFLLEQKDEHEWVISDLTAWLFFFRFR